VSYFDRRSRCEVTSIGRARDAVIEHLAVTGGVLRAEKVDASTKTFDNIPTATVGFCRARAAALAKRQQSDINERCTALAVGDVPGDRRLRIEVEVDTGRDLTRHDLYWRTRRGFTTIRRAARTGDVIVELVEQVHRRASPGSDVVLTGVEASKGVGSPAVGGVRAEVEAGLVEALDMSVGQRLTGLAPYRASDLPLPIQLEVDPGRWGPIDHGHLHCLGQIALAQALTRHVVEDLVDEAPDLGRHVVGAGVEAADREGPRPVAVVIRNGVEREIPSRDTHVTHGVAAIGRDDGPGDGTEGVELEVDTRDHRVDCHLDRCAGRRVATIRRSARARDVLVQLGEVGARLRRHEVRARRETWNRVAPADRVPAEPGAGGIPQLDTATDGVSSGRINDLPGDLAALVEGEIDTVAGLVILHHNRRPVGGSTATGRAAWAREVVVELVQVRPCAIRGDEVGPAGKAAEDVVTVLSGPLRADQEAVTTPGLHPNPVERGRGHRVGHDPADAAAAGDGHRIRSGGVDRAGDPDPIHTVLAGLEGHERLQADRVIVAHDLVGQGARTAAVNREHGVEVGSLRADVVGGRLRGGELEPDVRRVQRGAARCLAVIGGLGRAPSQCSGSRRGCFGAVVVGRNAASRGDNLSTDVHRTVQSRDQPAVALADETQAGEPIPQDLDLGQEQSRVRARVTQDLAGKVIQEVADLIRIKGDCRLERETGQRRLTQTSRLVAEPTVDPLQLEVGPRHAFELRWWCRTGGPAAPTDHTGEQSAECTHDYLRRVNPADEMTSRRSEPSIVTTV